jgi:subtilisin family serine protease
MPNVATIIVRSGAALVAAVLAAAAVPDRLPTSQAGESARTRVIIQAAAGHSAAELAPVVERMGGTMGPALDIINAQAAVLPDAAIAEITGHPAVARISRDHAVAGTMERTAATVGALAARETFGYDGTGVGIAIIDSGVTPWHDDLAAGEGGQRIARFVDLVGNRPNAYDDYGHGTHVAGIIAGDGFDSGGARAGIAPGARLTVFKVLDDQGNGRISDVIAAFDYILKRRDTLNIRVVNLSVASGVHESYNTDALAVAAKRLVEAGIVVVAAAGNRGQTANGHDAYGGITSPGNAPWVLTVGASNHMGSVARDDDRMAEFSSRGPTPIDLAAKPDLVAPGVGIESLSNADSTFYRVLAPFLLEGTVPRGYLPYLSLTGTSMAAPVVTGTIALMLQANPALTPNAVKAILQYTAEVNRGYDPLTQGGGFLNAAGAVELARAFAAGAAIAGSTQASWSRTVIWGNQLTRTSSLPNDADQWASSVMWGAAAGSLTGNDPRNVVWGRRCGGSDCREAWTLAAAHDESVVWGTNADESVVWGTTTQDESVVWGTTVRQRH